MQIGRHVAGLIEDGSTMQMGIGAIPDGVLYYLKDKKDLGIHTEMFSDGVVELYEKGVVTGEKKTIDRGKMVAGFLIGSKRLYDFVDNNPVVEMRPTEYVNDPYVIRQNDKMVAINSAIEVDLTGQVCADSIGPRLYSGVGGQLDFIRGAARSRGRQADHRPPVERRREGRGALHAHRLDAQAGRRRRDDAVRRPLRRHGVRRREPLREDDPAAGEGAHRRGPPRLPRGAGAEGDRAAVHLTRRRAAGRGRPPGARRAAFDLQALALPLVRADPPVDHREDPVAAGGDPLVVRDDEEGRPVLRPRPGAGARRPASPDSVSRFPVGSSARTRGGSRTSARATATRCCWPPESFVAR